MPEGPDGKTIIIVKKVAGHGGHHGGAWKVAYADFVTAMMALFLVLWLVNSASVTTREAIASYFKRPGVFEKGSGTPLEIGGGGILPDTFAPPAEANSQIVANKKIYASEDTEEDVAPKRGKGGSGSGEEELNFERIASEIQSSVKQQQGAVAGFVGEIGVKVDQRGLHLEIMDTPTASMFQSGSASISPEAREVLKRISAILIQLPNPIDIEGHTDSAPFREGIREKYDNWDLSTHRANVARRTLEELGLKPVQVARVVGYADRRLKVPGEPLDPSNRRISISMRYTEQAAAALAGSNATETRPLPVQPTNPTGTVVPTPPGVKVPDYVRALDQLLPAEEPEDPAERLPVKDDINRLKVEVGTSAPDGTPISESEPGGPVWMEKDKIFGDTNPFQ